VQEEGLASDSGTLLCTIKSNSPESDTFEASYGGEKAKISNFEKCYKDEMEKHKDEIERNVIGQVIKQAEDRPRQGTGLFAMMGGMIQQKPIVGQDASTAKSHK
jgi:hypothetical protein